MTITIELQKAMETEGMQCHPLPDVSFSCIMFRKEPTVMSNLTIKLKVVRIETATLNFKKLFLDTSTKMLAAENIRLLQMLQLQSSYRTNRYHNSIRYHSGNTSL